MILTITIKEMFMITKLNIKTGIPANLESKAGLEKATDNLFQGFKERVDDDGNPCLKFTVTSTQENAKTKEISIAISKGLFRSIIDAIKTAFGRKTSTEDAQAIIEKVMAKIANMPDGESKNKLIEFISSDRGADDLNWRFSTFIHFGIVHDQLKLISPWDVKGDGLEGTHLKVANPDHQEKIAEQTFSQLEKMANPALKISKKIIKR